MSDSKLIPFLFDGEMLVRVEADENGDLWFAAADVCRVLGIRNVSQAVDALDPDEVRLSRRDGAQGPLCNTEGSTNGLNLNEVSEAGLYALIMRSRKPNARRFDRWVRHEVLPTLRKTGSYDMAGRPGASEERETDPTTALKVVGESRLTYGVRAAQQVWLKCRHLPIVPAMIDSIVAHHRSGELDLGDDEALRRVLMAKHGMVPDDDGGLH